MSTTPHFRCMVSTERGFSMVEVLVALVVLGVGMLGMASLYVVSLRASGSAISRMQAVNLASDIGDRIRANRNAGTAYAGTAADNGTGCIGADKTCAPAAMAAHDLFVWQQQIVATLPGDPEGTIEVDTSTNPNTYTITVSWLESGEAGDDGENRLQYVMRMQI